MLIRNALVCILATALLGCSTNEQPTEEGCTGNDTPPVSMQDSILWDWMDITVGQSSEEEIIAKFGPPEQTVVWPITASPVACVYYYHRDDVFFGVWLAGGQAIGLEFRDIKPNYRINETAMPASFEQAKQLYGRADIVGWSDRGSGFRSIAWLEQGIQADISLIANNRIAIARFFPEFTSEEFEATLWSNLVFNEQSSGGDVVDTAPRDPFDWSTPP